MTLHNRSPAHRQINARQKHGGLGPFRPVDAPTSTDTLTDTSSATPSPPTSSDPPPPATSNKPTRSNTPPPNTSKPTPSPTPTPTTDSLTKNTSTSSDPPTSVSNTDTPTSIRTVNSSSSKTTSTGAVTITGPPKTLTQTNTFGTFTPTVTDDSSASISSSTPSASSGISTGAIVGSVAGGIAAIALIGLIIAFFLRRWRRNRITDEDFNPDEFVRSPNMSDTGYRASTFDPVPPSMAHRGHVVTPSIGSTNMAGQGAYPYNPSAGVQERQMYTYGQGYDANGGADDGSEMARGGPYSSQPQPQAVYNPEAYGSYAYTTDGNHAVSSQAYHPYSSQEYQTHYQDNAAPALVAGAPAVPAGRAAHVVNHDDAYGGI